MFGLYFDISKNTQKIYNQIVFLQKLEFQYGYTHLRYTPLILGIILGHEELVKLLLDYRHEKIPCNQLSFLDDCSGANYHTDVNKDSESTLYTKPVTFTAEDCNIKVKN